VGLESIFPRQLFHIGSVGIKDTVLQTWIVIAALAGFAFWSRNQYRAWEPRGWQLVVEYIVEYVESLILDTVGRAVPEITAYMTTMIVFIAIANLLGLLPLFLAPTRDINTTMALSLISLLSTYYFAITKRGPVAWFKTMINPLNIIGQLSRLLSMGLRLFGNIISGEIIGGVMFMLLPVLAPLPFSLLNSITGVLQALVFTVLTLVFVVDAMGSES